MANPTAPTPARASPGLRLLLAVFALCAAALAQAQSSSCSSDGQPAPAALLERFINADCEACWSDAQPPAPGTGEVALDWVVPGTRGDDAPLSAAARREGQARLRALRRDVPANSSSVRSLAKPDRHKLRVAHGLPVNNYIGASIELQPGAGGPWTAWLALVETIPAGVEGTPVERNLVRNVLQPAWDVRRPLSKAERARLFESRPMNIPEGANPDRLRVVGIVEDRQGRIVALAQSRCAP